MPDYEREHEAYRERVRSRYEAIRREVNEHGRERLRAHRRLQRQPPCCDFYPECAHVLALLEEPEPRSNRRPALALAIVFVALVVALLFVARANGTQAGTDDTQPMAASFSQGDREAARSRGASPPSRSAIRSIICSVFTGTRCGPAIRVAKCETGGTFYPRALGSAGERGLFQIHPVHFRTFDKRRLFEPRYNARAAFRLSRGGRDWSPWSCQP